MVSVKAGLLKKLRSDKNPDTKCRIKNLSMEIKTHFLNERKIK